MRADSATVASVWLRNTTTVISDSDAASTASGASRPSVARRRTDDLGDGPRAGQQRGDGDQPLRRQRRGQHRDDDRHRGREPVAGWRSRVSTSIQVSITPSAISGSGRRPLLNGSQAARNTAPAVNTATRLARQAAPCRGPAVAARSG